MFSCGLGLVSPAYQTIEVLCEMQSLGVGLFRKLQMGDCTKIAKRVWSPTLRMQVLWAYNNGFVKTVLLFFLVQLHALWLHHAWVFRVKSSLGYHIHVAFEGLHVSNQALWLYTCLSMWLCMKIKPVGWRTMNMFASTTQSQAFWLICYSHGLLYLVLMFSIQTLLAILSHVLLHLEAAFSKYSLEFG